MNARANVRAGFTLVEILLVILIIGMLAGVFIAVIIPSREGAREDTTRLLVETTIPGALDRYNMDIGWYPKEEEGGLEALRKKPTFEDENLGQKWRGPYLKKEPKDAWGRALHYEVVESGADENLGVSYKLWSDGKDGQSDTDDDIKNWSEEEGT